MQEDIDASATNSALRPKPSDCKVTADHVHASWQEVFLQLRLQIYPFVKPLKLHQTISGLIPIEIICNICIVIVLFFFYSNFFFICINFFLSTLL